MARTCNREWNYGEKYDVSIEELLKRREKAIAGHCYSYLQQLDDMIALRTGETHNRESREVALSNVGQDVDSFSFSR